MSYSAQIQEVLNAAGVDRPVLLGMGEDALAFSLSDREAIRIFGDAYPGNIMVDEAAQVVSVLDFGRHSLLSDPRLDVAIAIELTDVIDEFTQDDAKYLRELVDEEISGAWRALSAILLAYQLRGDQRIVRKCAASLVEAAERF